MAKKTTVRKTGRRKTGTREARRGTPAAGKRKQASGSRKRTSGSRKQAAVSRKAAGGRKARGGTRKPTATAKATATVKGVLKGAVAAVTQRMPGADTDAITLLINDHRELQDLLKRGEETSDRAGKERKSLLDAIAATLTVHETIEEKVLYPALESHPETHDIVLEGFQEHHVADLIVKELYDTKTTAEEWAAKFKVFKENIDHHIEEEEGEMFRTARGVMTQEELVELGVKMARMKADLERRGRS